MTEVVNDFLSIVPKDKTYLEYNVSPIALNVIQTDGVTYEPDIKITVTDLNKGKKHFLNNSGYGDTFKVNVIVKADDGAFLTYSKTWNAYYNKIIKDYDGDIQKGFSEKPYTTKKDLRFLLDYWIRNMTVLMVTTRASDISNGEYIITDNKSRKQTYEQYSIWELTFTKYVGVKSLYWQNDSTYTSKITKKYERVKQNKFLNSKLRKCSVGAMKLNKKNYCCYYLNQKLVLKGFIKSKTWNTMKKGGTEKTYTKSTASGLKLFQTKYQKKYNLKKNGVMDKATLKALTSI